MKRIFIIITLLIVSFFVKSQPYVTATVQVSNPPPCTVCCTGSISATPVSSLCPGAPVNIGVQSSSTGTLIQWGNQYLYNLCSGIYTVVVSGMSGPPCDGIVVCYPYYPVTTQITKNRQDLNDISIYPNPANDKLNIQFISRNAEYVNAQIVNSIGQLVKETEVVYSNGQSTVNIEELPTGIYILSFKNEKSLIISKRFIIVK